MPAPRFTLRIELGDGQAFSHPLTLPRTVLGRASATDVPLRADGVSREHVAFVLDGEQLILEDLGSTNGTRRNGAPVTGRLRVVDGDQIGVGRALITVQLDSTQSVNGLTPNLTPELQPSIVATLEADDAEVPHLAQEHRELRALYQLGKALDPGASEAELQRLIVEVARSVFDGERVIVRTEHAVLVGGSDASVSVPAAVEAKLLREGRAVLTVGDGAQARSILAVPLRSRAPALPGFIYIDADLSRRRYTPRDLDLATILAHQAAALLDNARLVRELAAARDRLAAENVELRGELSGKFGFEGVLGASGKLQDVLRIVSKLAETDSTVLITGESGTGKELIARTVHFNSPRRREPFQAINCAAIPENLIEAELFGIERGVATGVDKRAGKFEAAEGGTLFLDEIGELPLPVQAKLLRVLEERRVERVGGRASVAVRARIVAATNKNLSAEVAAGRFREDLFYRLNVVPLRLPPLRERPEDIAALAHAFLAKHARAQKRAITGFSPAALDALRTHAWPGNVRELQNEIERIVTIWEPGADSLIHAEHLSIEVRAAVASPAHLVEDLEVGDIKEVVGALVERVERRLILAALAKTGDNRAKAATLLGLTREGLRKKMIRYAME